MVVDAMAPLLQKLELPLNIQLADAGCFAAEADLAMVEHIAATSVSDEHLSHTSVLSIGAAQRCGCKKQHPSLLETP